ncbi:RNA polymerase sigma factor [Micromonospora aurantiaca]|uniref:Sigma-70 family RNA polymerase sigma factor n=1 Tax=Micromonospora aurantiaca (nom. illeg.) TaxID=47850 RepID=A0A6N3KCA2_9ACTN|nr:sigma-70 family RNA polymerase sigma factor [Micromonospora aurantiaca]AXH94513.1 sigma-70 family RNA polymerase sigma factor [Micromonospora aurantiaca]KAB1108905.1 sigma-70 family RNA polymerase sigma factor [Micromonospora aurantiaca]UFN96096.1 sigma-70 family RNA polymerase sigma factor [Micromonospora aurantiaca]
MHRAEAQEPGPPEVGLPGEPADGDLIRESVTEPERFAPLFDRHAVAVHRYLARRIGAPADDLLAETFLVAFRRRAAYRPDVGVRPWLFGIATNLLRRHVRAEERRYRALARLATGEEPPKVIDDAIDRLDAQALRRDLATALASLHRRDRDVLLLTAWADLSYEQIAAVLDVPVGTVRSRLHRARRLTRLALTLEETT